MWKRRAGARNFDLRKLSRANVDHSLWSWWWCPPNWYPYQHGVCDGLPYVDSGYKSIRLASLARIDARVRVGANRCTTSGLPLLFEIKPELHVVIECVPPQSGGVV
jgi:hypothetical protein